MAKKRRDYRAEYKRRIARGRARGMSVSQSRGHPKTELVEVRIRRKGKLVTVKRRRRVELSVSTVKLANDRAKGRGIRPILKPGATRKDLKRAIARDAMYVFGDLPRRVVDETGDGGAPEYQLRLQMLASRMGAFDWLSEKAFIASMMALGLTEREAYSNWFSPGGVNA